MDNKVINLNYHKNANKTVQIRSSFDIFSKLHGRGKISQITPWAI